ncbi:MAG: hypothetical protein GC206_13255 [Alphaproteobacteria bacterium]|nr:hypothetical protein [Alphaproteobacteria bacterium]
MSHPNIYQADEGENADARALVGVCLDDMAEALSQRFKNQKLCFKLLALKMLIEDASDLDPHAALSYVSAILDEVNSPTTPTTVRQAAAIDLLARAEWARQQKARGR